MNQSLNKEKPYKKVAKYYDFVYSGKNYKKEADQLRKLIGKYKKSSGRELLEIACGTGGHLQYLKKSFLITATDLNPEMLEVARRKNKSGVTFKQADMIKLNLEKKFDIILCLFSSIGYVKTYANLRKVLIHFSHHLEKGGVTIIEPWLTKSAYRVGMPAMSTYSDKNVKIARLNTTRIHGDISVMDMHYLIAKKGKNIKYFVDRHELGMFDIDKFLKLMRKAGLKAKFVKNGLMPKRGLYIGVKK